MTSFPILENSLLRQIEDIAEIPSDFYTGISALEDPREEGHIIPDRLIWITFREAVFKNQIESVPITSSLEVKYSIYIAVKSHLQALAHQESSRYIAPILKGVFNKFPRCLDGLFTFYRSGWQIEKVKFKTHWKESDHWVYEIFISIPLLLNIETERVVSGVVADEHCDLDNPFDPDCYIDYERQVLVCPDGERPLISVNFTVIRNRRDGLGEPFVDAR